MDMFDWEEIKSVGDCVVYCERVLGMARKGESKGWVRFDNPWRAGSDSGAFSVKKEGYFDHVSQEKGSILDLAMNAKHSGDIWAAQEELGKYLGLKCGKKAHEKREFVCAYDYRGLDGELKHQTVRWKPKSFSQRRPDPEKAGEWIWDLVGVDLVLYRLQEWKDLPWVCVVGGEKDADNCWKIGVPATTNALGEGNWRKEYNEWFRGKWVCVIPDKDVVGRKHAEVVCGELLGIAKGLKVLELPGDGKDVSDWIEEGGDGDALRELVRKEENLKLETGTLKGGSEEENLKPETGNLKKENLKFEIGDLKEEKNESEETEKKRAKVLNGESFRNFAFEDVAGAGGREREIKRPRHVLAMVDECFGRFLGFPRRVGGTLFDHDRKTEGIRYLDATAAFFAWMTEKSGRQVDWAKLEGCVTQEQFFCSIHANCVVYDMISGVPTWPRRDDVYYTHGRLPEATEDGRYLRELCEFFCPATDEDKELLRVFFASPLYYKAHVERPLWVIDSPDGQGCGKTKIVEFLALLYGGGETESSEPIWVDSHQLGNENTSDRIVKRVLSRSGRKKRIFLLDNVEGYFKCSGLATLVTQGSISGMAPYGHGEETRQNDLTYVLTSNNATVDRDLVSRSFILHVKKPESPRKKWEGEVKGFIERNRMQIMADMIQILERGPSFEFTPATRFRMWECEVMAPMLGSMEVYEKVFMQNEDRKRSADGDVVEGDMIEEHVADVLGKLGLNPETDVVWIRSRALIDMAQWAVPGFGGRTGRGAMYLLKNMIRCRTLTRIGAAFEKWPTSSNRTRHRGMMWNEFIYEPFSEGDVKVVDADANGLLVVSEKGVA